MEILANVLSLLGGAFSYLYESLGNSLFIIIPFLLFIGIVAMWRMFEKANQPGWACIVPIYNVIVFLRIVGRPAKHIWLFLIPVYNIYLLFKVHFELIESFGQRNVLDYFLLVIFNVFYIMNLGLSYENIYEGPAYQTSKEGSSNVGSAQVA